MHRDAMSAAGYGQPYRSGYGEASSSGLLQREVLFAGLGGRWGGGSGSRVFGSCLLFCLLRVRAGNLRIRIVFLWITDDNGLGFGCF